MTTSRWYLVGLLRGLGLAVVALFHSVQSGALLAVGVGAILLSVALQPEEPA